MLPSQGCLRMVQEHLELYAKIKGVPQYTIDNVKEKMVEFGLLKHANKPSFTLSGGNKRKLSVAMAMIGDPPIVILDKPSTEKGTHFINRILANRQSAARSNERKILFTESLAYLFFLVFVSCLTF
ncbi:hypothetical protein PIB30_009736 [Stylosanthes scabra]|uniref:ABC transporter domain-containing protein n=1 Tax=Stylosanthes scabra TaxID=79078 RepID=A0ABU6W6F1_9FABA|nr:hypothetical protein [Stylosanthes scabra]